MQDRKCFFCGNSGYITYHYRNKRKEEESKRIENKRPEYQSLRNIFEVLTSRVMKTTIEEDNCLTSAESSKKEKKKKLLREVMIKIGLKQEDKEEGIIVKVLLDSGTIGLIISLEFVKKNKFRKKKLNKLIYMRNMNSIFNYKRLIEHIVEIELFYRK